MSIGGGGGTRAKARGCDVRGSWLRLRVLEVTAVQWTACRRRPASACATLLLIALSLIRVRGADPRGANAVAVEMGLQPPTTGGADASAKSRPPPDTARSCELGRQRHQRFTGE